MAPALFGVRPSLVLKGGMIAWAVMGDSNASIPTPQPVLPRPMFRAAAATAVHFVAPGALERGLADMLLNDALPRIEVEPDTFTVRIDGEVVDPEPVAELPMAQRYFLF